MSVELQQFPQVLWWRKAEVSGKNAEEGAMQGSSDRVHRALHFHPVTLQRDMDGRAPHQLPSRIPEMRGNKQRGDLDGITIEKT